MEVFAVILNPVHRTFPLKRIMKIRKSFFIRWLLVRDEEKQEKSVVDIEHIQSGDSQRVSSLEEANQWMREVEVEPEKVSAIDN